MEILQKKPHRATDKVEVTGLTLEESKWLHRIRGQRARSKLRTDMRKYRFSLLDVRV
jgi:hypothetical protein